MTALVQTVCNLSDIKIIPLDYSKIFINRTLKLNKGYENILK